jgi:uncharacterized protein
MSSPNIVIGVPEAGLVGLIAGSYMIQQLKLPEIGHVDSDLSPQVVVVHESEPRYPIRIFGNEHLIIVLSEMPLHARFSYELGVELEKWAKSKGARMVIGVTGAPSKERMESEKEEKPKVFGVSNSKEVTDTLKQLGIQLFEEGIIAGTYATLLREGITQNVPNLTVLVEAYPEFPDPSAAASSIEVLNSLLSTNIDTKPLMQESEEIRLRMRDVMRRTQQSMQPAMEAPSVYR